MKTPGQGSVTRLRNGRYWVRSPERSDGSRPGLGTYATEEEANSVLDLARARTASGVTTGRGIPFLKFGREVLDQREGDGYRSVKKERGRLEHHLAFSPIANLTLQELGGANGPMHAAELVRWLGRREADDKRGRRKIKRATVQAVKTVASIVMNEALVRTLVVSNAFAAAKVRRRPDEDTEEEWTYLTLEEQSRFANCESIPYEDRLIFRFALGSGLREGELHHNLLKDLHVGPSEEKPHLVVRYGSKGMTPKNGKRRTVYLFGDALEAAREWVEFVRPTYLRKPAGARHEVRKDEGLIFPTRTGCRRQTSKTFGNGWYEKDHPRATGNGWVSALDHYYHLAGVEDRVGLHFHAIRHTCATSMLQGLWGRLWFLEEVQEHLGHSTIQVTQRYAHKTGDRVARAAREANEGGYKLVTTPRPTPTSLAANLNHSAGSRESGLNRRPALYESSHGSNVFAILDAKDPSESSARNHLSRIATLAASYRELVAKGQHEAALAVGAALAGAVESDTLVG